MKTLEDICRVPVRFSEIDSMRRVWHGSFVTYFEDGRESFGRRYPGIGYDTTYVYKPGARLDYHFRVFRESDGALCAEGETVQLFIDGQGELMLDKPDYFREWQKRYLSLPEEEL